MGFRTSSPIKFFPIVLARLADDSIPDGKRIKKLQGFKDVLYRLRAGDYRVVFQRSGTRIDIVRVLSKPDFQKAY